MFMALHAGKKKFGRWHSETFLLFTCLFHFLLFIFFSTCKAWNFIQTVWNIEHYFLGKLRKNYKLRIKLSSTCRLLILLKINNGNRYVRGLVKKYLTMILGLFFLLLHKNICCRYSFEAPRQDASNEYPQHIFFMKNWRKLSQNYHLILLVKNSLHQCMLHVWQKAFS